MTTTSIVFLLVATIAGTLAAVFDASRYPDFNQVNPLAVAQQERKIKVGSSMSLSVSQPAAVAVPISFTAGDYNGPYDPADPKGIGAAARRRGKMESAVRKETIKSYIPPGTGKFAKKEAVKLAIDEGKRFAFAHPKETAELLGVVTKAKSLYTTASHKLTELEKKQAEGKLRY